MSDIPKPGSKAAIDAGCICPVMDNHHGEGIPLKDPDGTTHHAFWMHGDCVLHGIKKAKVEE